MKVGLVTTHISPAKGYGGPAVSARVLSDQWAREGATLTICSSDGSEERTIRPEDVRLDDKVQVFLYHTYWFRRWGFGLGAIAAVARTCLRSDVIYINGIATWPTTLGAWISSLLNKHFVVALRGGLMPEHVKEIRTNKRIKWLYYKWLVLPMLRRASGIHCTGGTEAECCTAILGGKGEAFVVPNGVTFDDVPTTSLPNSSGLILCFLGRIAYEKGINCFVKAWLDVYRPGDRLIVAGSGSGSYFREFQHLLERGAGAIEYRGYLDSAGVGGVFRESHFVVLPSGLEGGVRENFGNVVAEAFRHSRPAMVAKGLAWDHIEEEGAGLLFERDAAAVKEMIRLAQSLTCERREAMSIAARRYAEAHLDSAVTSDQVWQYLAACRTKGIHDRRCKDPG